MQPVGDTAEEVLVRQVQALILNALKSPDQANVLDQDGFSALHHATIQGHTAIMEQLLAAGASVDLRQGNAPDGPTALCLAASNGHLEAVDVLIESNADVNMQCKLGGDERCTPLVLAGNNGHFEVVRRLLVSHADPKLSSKNKNSILRSTIIYNQLHLLEELFQSGVPIDSELLLERTEDIDDDGEGGEEASSEDNDDHSSGDEDESSSEVAGILKRPPVIIGQALHVAADLGNEAAIQILLSYGADANALDSFERSPVHLAARQGHKETTRTIVNAQIKSGSALVNERDRAGYTAVHYAAAHGHAEVIKMLISEYGANPNTRFINNVDGLFGNKPCSGSALQLAVKGGHLQAVQCLLQLGARVNIRDDFARTPLHTAVFYNQYEVATLLLKAGAVVDSECRFPSLLGDCPCSEAKFQRPLTSHDNVTPLHLAVYFSKRDIVSLLTNFGADLDRATELGFTPLLLAVVGTDPRVVDILVGSGAKVDLETTRGITVRKSCLKGTIEAFARLLTTDNVNDTDDNKQSLLHLAARSLIDPAAKIRAICKYSPNLDSVDEKLRTPLYTALKRWWYGPAADVVEALLDAGADPFFRVEETTPLICRMITHANEKINGPMRLLKWRKHGVPALMTLLFHESFSASVENKWADIPEDPMLCPEIEVALYTVYKKAPGELKEVFKRLEETKKTVVQATLRGLHRNLRGLYGCHMFILAEVLDCQKGNL